MSEEEFKMELDLTSDVNSALVRMPYGYAEFGGTRVARVRRARMFMAMEKWYMEQVVNKNDESR